MRRIRDWDLWVGGRGDVRDIQALVRVGVEALVDLAIDEAPVVIGREIISCRFPLLDGAGNEPALVRVAVETVAGLIKAQVPALVFCSAGLSRSPSICAGGLALATGKKAAECLELVLRGAPGDVSPGMWGAVMRALENGDR